MGQQYLLQGANFINPKFPKIYPDKVLTEGSLALVDFTHSLGGVTGIPSTATGNIPNIAWKQANALIGGQTEASLALDAINNFTAPEAMLERTTKGAFNAIISQINKTGGEYLMQLPVAIRNYMFANPTRNYAIWLWYRMLRTTPSGSGNMIAAQVSSSVSASTNRWWNLTLTNAVTGAAARASAQAATGFSGTLPGSAASLLCWLAIFGNSPSFQGLNNVCQSFVFYRAHLVDVAASGKTFAELDAADAALFAELFGTGGRLAGDSWETDPAEFP